MAADTKQVTRSVTAAIANRRMDDESAFDAPWIHDRIGFCLPPWLMMTEYLKCPTTALTYLNFDGLSLAYVFDNFRITNMYSFL